MSTGQDPAVHHNAIQLLLEPHDIYIIFLENHKKEYRQMHSISHIGHHAKTLS